MSESSESWESLETICTASNGLTTVVEAQLREAVTHLLILRFSTTGPRTCSEHFEGVSLSTFIKRKKPLKVSIDAHRTKLTDLKSIHLMVSTT